MHPIIAKIWVGMTIVICVIPIGLVIYWLVKKCISLWDRSVDQRRLKEEMKEMKEVLEEQQDEFISSNEYGTYAPAEIPGEEAQVATEDSDEEQKEENLTSEVDIPQEQQKPFTDKDRKKLDAILREAQHLKGVGKFEEYEKKLVEGLSIDPEAMEFIKPLSELYFMLGNYKKAISLLKKVTENDPSDHKAFWQIGEIYFMTGYHQTAELLIEKAISLKNDNPKYYLTMVEIYYNTKRYPEALAFMEKIIKLRPTNPKYLLATAELYEEMGDLDNARKYYFNVLEYEASNEKAKAKIKELSYSA